MRAFVTVVEEGSLSGAARRLHVSQPAVPPRHQVSGDWPPNAPIDRYDHRRRATRPAFPVSGR
ncbi:helix-turn-helix domain-containing protein [Micromonospora sp. IBHARD004]|uniref:helix-turn-helix domain-containing protein n=1 Tax=Micromonospora sp. IBHARD004 TaxID=3457764 RepID=UPI004059C3C5